MYQNIPEDIVELFRENGIDEEQIQAADDYVGAGGELEDIYTDLMEGAVQKPQFRSSRCGFGSGMVGLENSAKHFVLEPGELDEYKPEPESIDEDEDEDEDEFCDEEEPLEEGEEDDGSGLIEEGLGPLSGTSWTKVGAQWSDDGKVVQFYF